MIQAPLLGETQTAGAFARSYSAGKMPSESGADQNVVSIEEPVVMMPTAPRSVASAHG